jgi:tetratricopeptide (TPR) repeat protein
MHAGADSAEQAAATQLREALLLHQAGALREALAIYEALLPASQAPHSLLRLAGMAQFQSGEVEAGVQRLRQSLALQPDDAEAQTNLGLVLWSLGQRVEAQACFDQAIAVQPDYWPASLQRANALSDLGDFAAALIDYSRIIAAAEALAERAEACYKRAHASRMLGRYDEALQDCQQALALLPDSADAHHQYAHVLADLRQPQAALAAYDAALALQPDGAQLHYSRGNVLADLEQLDEALASYDMAIALQPDFVAACNNRGVVLRSLMRLDEAMASYEQAIAWRPAEPEAYFNKAMICLLSGQYAEGWRLYERRWDCSLRAARLATDQPQWRGDFPLIGRRIVLHAEQGFGDTLQFCRYAVFLAAQGARVILRAPQALLRVLATLDGVSELVDEAADLPEHDCHCPLLSLPMALGTTLASVPASSAYLRSDPALAERWAQRLGERSGLRVGLVWAGGERAGQPDVWRAGLRRNIPLQALAPLKLAGANFYSLQKGAAAEAELAALQAAGWAGPQIIDHSAALEDFAETSALIEQLDLVIAADTAVAHLAAALGKEVWLLNRFDGCWRWLLEREDSPWYPSLTVFRQQVPGDWSGVVEEIRQRLLERLA